MHSVSASKWPVPAVPIERKEQQERQEEDGLEHRHEANADPDQEADDG